jgi:DNA-binding NtrC family response regulator
MARISKTRKAVLILEKDLDLADSIRMFLEDVYPVYILDDPSKLRSHINRYGIKLIVTDLDMATKDFHKKILNIRSAHPAVKIILMYMFLDEDEVKNHAILKEADDFIFKPFDANVFRHKVDRLLA